MVSVPNPNLASCLIITAHVQLSTEMKKKWDVTVLTLHHQLDQERQVNVSKEKDDGITESRQEVFGV